MSFVSLLTRHRLTARQHVTLLHESERQCRRVGAVDRRRCRMVRLLTQLFTREGIALRSVTTGAAGLDGLNPAPSLVLLDLMLRICMARKCSAACVSACGASSDHADGQGRSLDRVIGLELGADDYGETL